VTALALILAAAFLVGVPWVMWYSRCWHRRAVERPDMRDHRQKGR
jgi:hypothetical protein